MEFPKGEENVEEHKANEGGCLAKAHPGTDDAAGQVPSQTINDPPQKAHVGESKLCTCRRKDGGAKTCDGEAEVARVEGRVYCLMCALLIPTTTDHEEEEEEEEARDIKPQVIGGIKGTVAGTAGSTLRITFPLFIGFKFGSGIAKCLKI